LEALRQTIHEFREWLGIQFLIFDLINLMSENILTASVGRRGLSKHRVQPADHCSLDGRRAQYKVSGNGLTVLEKERNHKVMDIKLGEELEESSCQASLKHK
jgi:hypothetical protein